MTRILSSRPQDPEKKRIGYTMVVKGKKLTIKEHWQRLKGELKDMTPKQKLEHLWEYYKWVLGVLLLIVMIVATVISAIQSSQVNVRLAGAAINVDLSADGYRMLTDGYREQIDARGKRDSVELTNFFFDNPYTTVEQTNTFDVIESVDAKIAADLMDYILFDELAWEFLRSPDRLLDLRELFTPEQLDAMGAAVVKLYIPDTGEVIPMAINITDTEFYHRHIQTKETVYLAFSINTSRLDVCADLWQYIKGGQTDGLKTELSGCLVDVAVNQAGEALLTQDYFQRQGFRLGDQRVELTRQTLVPAKDDDEKDRKRVHDGLLDMAESGTADYFLCNEEGLELLKGALLADIRTLTDDPLPEQAVPVFSDDGQSVIALEISGTEFTKKYLETADTVYLVFSQHAAHPQACRDVLSMVLSGRE